MTSVAEHDGFLRAIIEAPADDSLRLVYADWLEDHGNSARAEFIRSQCALARLPWGDPGRQDLAEREQSLLGEHWNKWDEELRRLLKDSFPTDVWLRWDEAWASLSSTIFILNHAFAGKGLWNYHRGFVEHVEIPIPAFLKRAPELFGLAPIWALTVSRSLGGHLAEFVCCPYLANLRSLDLRGWDLGVEGARVLASSPNSASLTELKLDGTGLGDQGVQVLVESPYLTGLTHLDLASNEIGDAGALALACSPHLKGLSVLHLGHNNIHDEGVWALVESPYLSRPIRVVLYDNPCGRNESLSRDWPY